MDVSFVSFPTKPGKMRKMCKMMHVLRIELWKKFDAMRHPIQAGSLSVVFPKCSGHVHLYFGRYLLDCAMSFEMFVLLVVRGCCPHVSPCPRCPRCPRRRMRYMSFLRAIRLFRLLRVLRVAKVKAPLVKLVMFPTMLPCTTLGTHCGGSCEARIAVLAQLSLILQTQPAPQIVGRCWNMLEHVGIGHEFIIVKFEP